MKAIFGGPAAHELATYPKIAAIEQKLTVAGLQRTNFKGIKKTAGRPSLGMLMIRRYLRELSNLVTSRFAQTFSEPIDLTALADLVTILDLSLAIALQDVDHG